MGLLTTQHVLQVWQNPSVKDSSLSICLHRCVFVKASIGRDMVMEDSDFYELAGQALGISKPIGQLISIDELRQVGVKNKNILASIHLVSSQKRKVVIKVLI